MSKLRITRRRIQNLRKSLGNCKRSEIIKNFRLQGTSISKTNSANPARIMKRKETIGATDESKFAVKGDLWRKTICMVREKINMNEIRFGQVVSSSRNKKERYVFKKHNMMRTIYFL